MILVCYFWELEDKKSYLSKKIFVPPGLNESSPIALTAIIHNAWFDALEMRNPCETLEPERLLNQSNISLNEMIDAFENFDKPSIGVLCTILKDVIE